MNTLPTCIFTPASLTSSASTNACKAYKNIFISHFEDDIVKRLFITFGLQNLMKLPKMEPEMVLHYCPAIRPKRLDSRPLSHAPNLVTPSLFESYPFLNMLKTSLVNPLIDHNTSPPPPGSIISRLNY